MIMNDRHITIYELKKLPNLSTIIINGDECGDDDQIKKLEMLIDKFSKAYVYHPSKKFRLYVKMIGLNIYHTSPLWEDYH